MSRMLRSRRWGHVAAAWSALFGAVHVFWAVGGSVGLAESAGSTLADQRPTWFVVFGLWGVAALLAVATAVGELLSSGRLEGVPHLVLRLMAGGAAAILLVRGVLIEALLLAGAYDNNPSLSGAQRHWTLVLWNPWFLIGGLAFAAALRAGWRPRPVEFRPGADALV